MDSGLLALAALSALFIMLAAWGLLHFAASEQRIDDRLRGANTRVVRQGMDARTALAALTEMVSGIGSLIARSGLLSRNTVKEFEQTLTGSGIAGRNSLGLFIGAKLLLMFALPGGALLLMHGLDFEPDTANTVALMAGAAGMLGPDMVLRRLRNRYITNVESGIADMLDLMLICAQSGLALQPGLIRVELEIRDMYPQLAWEIAQTATELQIIADSRVALTNLGTRTGIDSLKRLTATLTQSLQYGTPLSEALRALSHEMRQETLTRFEEKAARLPILLTVPMIVFILPCVFIVVGGPAAIQILHTLG